MLVVMFTTIMSPFLQVVGPSIPRRVVATSLALQLNSVPLFSVLLHTVFIQGPEEYDAAALVESMPIIPAKASRPILKFILDIKSIDLLLSQLQLSINESGGLTVLWPQSYLPTQNLFDLRRLYVLMGAIVSHATVIAVCDEPRSRLASLND